MRFFRTMHSMGGLGVRLGRPARKSKAAIGLSLPVPAVRGVSTQSAAVAPTLVLPAGTAENDILLLLQETSGSEAAIIPAGYVQLANSPQISQATASGTQLSVAWKRAGPGEVAPVLGDSGDHTIAGLIAVSGCATSGDPFDTTSGSATTDAGLAFTVPGLTTVGSNRLVVAILSTTFDLLSSAEASGWTNPDLSNVTEIIDYLRTNGNGGGLFAAVGTRAAAGLVGNTTGTLVSGGQKAAFCLALRP